jgi:hypothetical protein
MIVVMIQDENKENNTRALMHPSFPTTDKFKNIKQKKQKKGDIHTHHHSPRMSITCQSIFFLRDTSTLIFLSFDDGTPTSFRE